MRWRNGLFAFLWYCNELATNMSCILFSATTHVVISVLLSSGMARNRRHALTLLMVRERRSCEVYTSSIVKPGHLWRNQSVVVIKTDGICCVTNQHKHVDDLFELPVSTNIQIHALVRNILLIWLVWCTHKTNKRLFNTLEQNFWAV